MQEAEGVKMGVSASPRDSGGKRIGPRGSLRYNNPTLDDILKFIDGLPVTPADKESLVKSARATPHGALSNFRKNYMRHLSKEGRR